VVSEIHGLRVGGTFSRNRAPRRQERASRARSRPPGRWLLQHLRSRHCYGALDPRTSGV